MRVRDIALAAQTSELFYSPDSQEVRLPVEVEDAHYGTRTDGERWWRTEYVTTTWPFRRPFRPNHVVLRRVEQTPWAGQWYQLTSFGRWEKY